MHPSSRPPEPLGVLQHGQILGPYRVDALLGAGGVSQVYAATHTTLGSRHALKLLSFPHPELQQVLLLEGRIQARLRHPNIVQVTDVIHHAGRAGLVMELVDGTDMERWLHAHGPPPLQVALLLFAQLLNAVEEAHLQGVTHGDLKPANILMARTSHGALAKVADFGLGLLLQRFQREHREIDAPIGSPGYMAPEQLTTPTLIGPHTDIFALGAVLYEILAGRPAFPPTQDDSGLHRTLVQTPLDLRIWAPDCPDEVADAIMRALHREPEQRFPDVQTLRSALFPEGIPGMTPIRGWPALPPSSPTLFPLQEHAPSPPPTAKPSAAARPPTHPWQRYLTAALIGALIGTVGLGGWWYGQREAQTSGFSSGQLRTPLPPASNLISSPRLLTVPLPHEPPPAPPTVSALTVSAPPAAPQEPPPSAATTEAEATAAPMLPEATPAAETAPVATATPAPAAAEAETAPAPRAASPEALPSRSSAGDVQGTWSGRADGRPFSLVLRVQGSGRLSGTLRVQLGTSWRTFSVQGRLEGAEISLSDGGQLELRASLSGSQLVGGYLRIGRMEASGWVAGR